MNPHPSVLLPIRSFLSKAVRAEESECKNPSRWEAQKCSLPNPSPLPPSTWSRSLWQEGVFNHGLSLWSSNAISYLERRGGTRDQGKAATSRRASLKCCPRPTPQENPIWEDYLGAARCGQSCCVCIWCDRGREDSGDLWGPPREPLNAQLPRA